MDTGEKILFVANCLLALYGVGGLVSTWLLPRLQRTWLFGPAMLTGHLDANDSNRTLMSLLVLSAGASQALLLTRHTILGGLAVAVLLGVAIAKMKLARRRPQV